VSKPNPIPQQVTPQGPPAPIEAPVDIEGIFKDPFVNQAPTSTPGNPMDSGLFSTPGGPDEEVKAPNQSSGLEDYSEAFNAPSFTESTPGAGNPYEESKGMPPQPKSSMPFAPSQSTIGTPGGTSNVGLGSNPFDSGATPGGPSTTPGEP